MFIDDLIKELNEKDERGQLGLIIAVDILGKEECRRLLKQAKERHGELLTSDNSRPRTLSGCFFASMDKNVRRRLNQKRREIQKRNEVKFALEGVLHLIYEFVPPETFSNSVEHSGMDEGQVLCAKIIEDARQVLLKYMTSREMEESPVFQR